MSDLMLDADQGTSWNFQKACQQIRAERGDRAADSFAHDFGYIGFNWTGSEATLMERVAEKHNYRVDWHGAERDAPPH